MDTSWSDEEVQSEASSETHSEDFISPEGITYYEHPEVPRHEIYKDPALQQPRIASEGSKGKVFDVGSQKQWPVKITESTHYKGKFYKIGYFPDMYLIDPEDFHDEEDKEVPYISYEEAVAKYQRIQNQEEIKEDTRKYFEAVRKKQKQGKNMYACAYCRMTMASSSLYVVTRHMYPTGYKPFYCKTPLKSATTRKGCPARIDANGKVLEDRRPLRMTFVEFEETDRLTRGGDMRATSSTMATTNEQN